MLSKIKKGLWLVFSTLWLFGVAQPRDSFPDVLPMNTTIADKDAIGRTFFSDMGAWHAYASVDSSHSMAGFAGPLLMEMQGEWLSENIAQLTVYKNDQKINLNTITSHAFPGILTQKILSDSLSIQLKLIFISDRKSLIHTQIVNQSDKPALIQVEWSGNVLSEATLPLAGNNEIMFNFSTSNQLFRIQYPRQDQYTINTDKSSYTSRSSSQNLAPGEKQNYTQIHSYYPFGYDRKTQQRNLNFNQLFKENQQRWNTYLDSCFHNLNLKTSTDKRLAVKAIETLITNWRSGAGDLWRDGIFPSASYQGFYGFWSWDSWKIAVGLAYFNTDLAKETILSMYDYQLEDGMIPDVIYGDKQENNLRDTKPPLSAWAVNEVFKQSNDTTFVREVFPKLISYHQWWYSHRDYNQNGLCEYGSTDGTHLAATWESGMDNAVRFDKGKMLKTQENAWSINQESVDLNSYLYQEKRSLAQLARIIGETEKVQRFSTEATDLKKRINSTFYSDSTRFYHDKILETQRFLKSYGPEGWTPLYTHVADTDKAREVVNKMMDEKKFFTYLPFPTVSIDDVEFKPDAYWRGLVWLDQYYFAVRALYNYGYFSEARLALDKLFQNAGGLINDAPIYENYNPLNGEGRNAPNFSWSAAHILMMLEIKQDLK